MAAAQGESRKRSKKYFGVGGHHHGKRWRGSRELEVGMQGILITCNMNQRKCTAEAFNLLNEYADQLYGPEKFQEDEWSCGEGDVDDALRREVAHLNAPPGKQERRFQALESGANNVIFIRTHNLESDKLVHHILSDLHATKKKKTRIILRMLPVTGTCRAFPEDMLRYLTTFLEPWFKKPNHATYQVAFKARNNNHNKRDDVIKAIAGLVGKMNSKNKVDLTKPELTIIVEVIKAVCCISVVREYTLYRKYNLQEVVKDDAPKTDDATTAEPEKEGDKTEAGDEESDAVKVQKKENEAVQEEDKECGAVELDDKESDAVEGKENDAVVEDKESDAVDVEKKENDAVEEEKKESDAVEEAAEEEEEKSSEEDMDEDDKPQDCKDVKGDGE
ncbi:THUMP domain-containing protein 1 [Dunckerocampus dactyliophorus]|uniref:THUMP domain-containing protein 1 n=1 Tax=Dunckerocampus dactyliophorus TaxID=161453 RepID=UPI00240653DC|nr:THUMP domain-containing protein 1 [Dunckerocampus dactyliophorus]